jgi:hypothetical protein
MLLSRHDAGPNLVEMGVTAARKRVRLFHTTRNVSGGVTHQFAKTELSAGSHLNDTLLSNGKWRTVEWVCVSGRSCRLNLCSLN